MDKFSLIRSNLSSEESSVLNDILESPFSTSQIQTLKGRNIIPDFNATTMEYIHDKWNPKTGDVFVASYPKTGSTWMAEILRQILYRRNKDLLDLSQALPLPFRFIEHQNVNKFPIVDKLPFKRRIFQTHMTPELMNFKKIKASNAKIVHVYRNPKDATVSWLKFLEKIPLGKVEPFKSMRDKGWDKFLNHVLEGDFHMNMKPGEWYPEYLLSWYPHRDNKTVYFVAYEDLKKDLFGEVKKLSEFLEDPLNDEEAAKVVETCEFNNMKEMALKRKSAFSVVLRKGEVGGWKDYFTVSQSERVDAIMEEKLKDTDIKFIYEFS